MFSQFAQAIRVRAVRRSNDEDDIDQLRQRLHRVLSILGGVANIFLMRAFDIGKPQMQSIDDIPTFIHAQRGLGHIGQVLRLFNMQLFHILHGRDQVEFVGNLAQGPDHLRVPGVADENGIW